MEPKLSSLQQRVLTATVGLPLWIVACLLGAPLFVGATVALALIARTELLRAYQKAGIRPNGLLALAGAVSPVLVLFPTSLPLPVFLAAVLLIASLQETARASHNAPIHTGRNLAYGLLCGAYLSLFSGLAQLRLCTWQSATTGSWPGLASCAALVLMTAAGTMSADTGAFFVGRALGKHPLAEGLSPKKTTEGLFGGALSSLLVCAGLGYLLLRAPQLGLLIGGLAALLGPLGDLFKSALKRELGIKDFGALLPGHGGILDRFDSLLFTAPVVVVLVTRALHWR